MTFICSECGRVIDPNVTHEENGVSYPDGMGCKLSKPEGTIYNLCFDCICKLGENKLKLKLLEILDK